MTVRELEHANGGPLHRPQEDVAQTCRLCFSTFESHSTLLDHLEATEACRDKYKDDGHQYCFICDKTFETVSFYLYFMNIKMIPYKLFKIIIIATWIFYRQVFKTDINWRFKNRNPTDLRVAICRYEKFIKILALQNWNPLPQLLKQWQPGQPAASQAFFRSDSGA